MSFKKLGHRRSAEKRFAKPDTFVGTEREGNRLIRAYSFEGVGLSGQQLHRNPKTSSIAKPRVISKRKLKIDPPRVQDGAIAASGYKLDKFGNKL